MSWNIIVWISTASPVVDIYTYMYMHYNNKEVATKTEANITKGKLIKKETRRKIFKKWRELLTNIIIWTFLVNSLTSQTKYYAIRFRYSMR